MSLGARARKYRSKLTEASLRRILSRTLPKRNGYLAPNASELLTEANHFGIRTDLQFRRLILKHRRALLSDDRETLNDRIYLNALAEDHDSSHIRDMRRRQYCFTWEALTRNAFELEFGRAYEEYSRKRDGL